MDQILAKMVEKVWGRNILYSILGLLAGGVVWLAFENRRLNEARTQDQINNAKVIASLRDYYEAKLDTFQQRHLNFVQNALYKLEQVQNKKR